MPGGLKSVKSPCGERTKPPLLMVAQSKEQVPYQPATTPSSLMLSAMVFSEEIDPSTGTENWTMYPSGCKKKLFAALSGAQSEQYPTTAPLEFRPVTTVGYAAPSELKIRAKPPAFDRTKPDETALGNG